MYTDLFPKCKEPRTLTFVSTTRSTPTAQPSEPTAGSLASGGSGSTAGGGKAPTRERLVRAASELFYREGTVAVGVDRICQQAQVSKRSMYQLFATKDDLVAAALTATGESWCRGTCRPTAARSPLDSASSAFSNGSMRPPEPLATPAARSSTPPPN